MEWTRRSLLGKHSTKGVNCFDHVHRLLNHRDRYVTAPNNDTLYSNAWLDLSEGPVVISVPRTRDRYFSLAFMDMYTNNFAILGTRTTGTEGGEYTVVGPDDAAPAGACNVLRAPTPRVWALGRLLIEDESDLAAAYEVQRGLFIHGGVKTIDDIDPRPPVSRAADWRRYFAASNRLLKRESPPVTDAKLLSQIAPLHIDPEQTFDPDAFSAVQASEIALGVAAARSDLARTTGLLGQDGREWSYPVAQIGNFGQSYEYRAQISVGYLAALPREEAMYMRAHGGGSRGLLDGTRDYVLHFAAGETPPVNSFWSLSLYEATDDGRLFFADTPLRRYAIGDRTSGLTFNLDGSLDIWIGAHSPSVEKELNWLPSPTTAFSLVMRCYLPQQSLIDGSYRLPAVELTRL